MLASLHATGEVAKLQRVITASTRVVLLAALPFALFLLLYGRWFLALFGPEFAGSAAMALTVLSVAELASVTMGSAGLVLMMTGHERDAAVGYVYSVGLNSVLGILGSSSPKTPKRPETWRFEPPNSPIIHDSGPRSRVFDI